MGILHWVGERWFELIQTFGIVAGLFFTVSALHRDDRSRSISNLILIKQQYREIWQELYERPDLARVLEGNPNLAKRPISTEERLFVKLLIVHLDTVYRAMNAGMFVRLEGLHDDIKAFFSMPIPKAVWGEFRSLQDRGFVSFVERLIL